MGAVMHDDPGLARLRERIVDAGRTGTPLAIRGHGSKTALMPDDARPAGAAEPLDMTALAGISAYEPSELVVTVRAGTPLAVLEAALAAEGQHLAFEPPRLTTPGAAGSGTVGGMVAAGLSGPSRMAAGSVRDHVLGVTMLDGRGELLSFGGQVMKNVAGYDVSRLMAGSWGRLGVLCEVSLKVLPEPVARCTRRFAMGQSEALAALTGWSRRPLPLQASAWHDGVLTVRLAGARAAVEAASQALGGEAVPETDAAVFWDSLRDRSHALWRYAAQGLPTGLRLWRLAVAPHAPSLRLRGHGLIEWHGGQRWWLSDEPSEAVHAAARGAGGHAECHAGQAPGQPRALPLPLVQATIERRLRQTFDPHGLFTRAPGASADAS
jgi:FAD/FMN-containing dehydrogenase